MSKLKDWLLRLPVLALVLAMGFSFNACTEDDTEETSHAPEYVTGTTNSGGYTELQLQHYTVNLTVLNEAGTPVSGASAEVLQGEDTALLWVELAGYYPAFEVLPLNSQTTRNSTLHLIPTGGFFQIYETDPSHIADLLGDGSVTAHCYEGTLSNILDTGMSTLGGFWSVRVTGEAAALGEAGIVNLSLFTSGINAPIFEELMFGAATIMTEDVLQYCLYTIEVDGQQWFLPWIQIGDVVQQASDYDYKFILTWGDYPTDLDSHLYTPSIDGAAYHVFYADRGNNVAPPYAWLDVDDTSSWGPEATTIEQLYPGTYTFAVYDWSGNGLLSTSGAHVEIFAGRERVGGVDVPATGGDGPNWWWTVGTVNGSSGAFTLVNTLNASGPAGAPMRREDMPLK